MVAQAAAAFGPCQRLSGSPCASGNNREPSPEARACAACSRRVTLFPPPRARQVPVRAQTLPAPAPPQGSLGFPGTRWHLWRERLQACLLGPPALAKGGEGGGLLEGGGHPAGLSVCWGSPLSPLSLS
ncbi:uncharacterized protein LOC126963673 [Macaca thibetana thibetana]|uniref:uncharacterized protein LOC126963673 n=1 Tax=Macaca thibetana thibetana TaxID=257877 RepID=UPI0021BC79CB|nr:uncharacterized protein LOC126963673 [Macaca thibetana thibetana]